MEDLKSHSAVTPFCNQFEYHPYCTNDSLRKYCVDSGIKVMAYSPLGSGSSLYPPLSGCSLLDNSVIKRIATANSRSAAQTLINWSTASDENVVPVVKSENEGRIVENMGALGWELSRDAVENISGLNENYRFFKSYGGVNGGWHDGVLEARGEYK